MSQEDADTLFYALRILPHAERDIEAHLVRIADMAGAEAGRAWYDGLRDAVALLSQGPWRHPVISENQRFRHEVRQFLYRRTPRGAAWRVLFTVAVAAPSQTTGCLMTERQSIKPFVLQEWDNANPRWDEFVQCLEQAAPEQSPFVLGEYSRSLPCFLCVALQEDQVVGFLRFGVQPIGPEENCPPLALDGLVLTEAKIHAFAVREQRRGQGMGTALQKWAIQQAKELNCYQLVSHTSAENAANFHVKLSLGFAAHPENGSVRLLMPLRSPR